jgi:hypothetical protein
VRDRRGRKNDMSKFKTSIFDLQREDPGGCDMMATTMADY